MQIAFFQTHYVNVNFSHYIKIIIKNFQLQKKIIFNLLYYQIRITSHSKRVLLQNMENRKIRIPLRNGKFRSQLANSYNKII